MSGAFLLFIVLAMQFFFLKYVVWLIFQLLTNPLFLQIVQIYSPFWHLSFSIFLVSFIPSIIFSFIFPKKLVLKITFHPYLLPHVKENLKYLNLFVAFFSVPIMRFELKLYNFSMKMFSFFTKLYCFDYIV